MLPQLTALLAILPAHKSHPGGHIRGVTPPPATTSVFVAGEGGYSSFRVPGLAASGSCNGTSSTTKGEVLLLCVEGRKFVRTLASIAC